MAQERRQPLPVGRYWLSVVSTPGGASKLDNFRAWAASNPTRVAIVKTEAADVANSNGAWFLFRILKPTRFDQAQFGFPNVAGPEINTAADTIQRPPVPQATDILPDLPKFSFDGLGSGVLLLALAYFAFGKK